MMKSQSMSLAWIVVNDLKKAIEFYTKTVGLKLMEHNEQYGWAEFEGHDGGSRLGVAQNCPSEEFVKPGQNAVVTFTVDNLDDAVTKMQASGAKMIGEKQVIPGHVAMQMSEDTDGNKFQMVEILAHKHKCCHC